MSIRNTIRRLMRSYVLDYLPKPIRNFISRIISRNDDLIAQRDITNKSPENQFYYALTRHIDLNSITTKKDKVKSKDKEEPIIEDSDFQELISSLNNKIKQTNSPKPGSVLDNIYEQLTKIVLYLYSDQYSIIANSLNDKKTYTSMDEYVYEVIGQIIDSIDDNTPNVTPKYIEEYMEVIYKYYLNFLSLEDVKDALVQMSIVNSIDGDSNDGETQDPEDNLRLIIDFYIFLLENFNGNEITLKSLNDITSILKSMNNTNLKLLIDSIEGLKFNMTGPEEVEMVLSQIKQISQFREEDLEQICNKIKFGKLNTIKLQKLLNTIEKKNYPEKRQVKGVKPFIGANKNYIIKGGIAVAAGLIGGLYLTYQTAINKDTTINPTVPTTESTNELESNEASQEDTYSLFYPALYTDTNENGKTIERLAYVALGNTRKELNDKNTIFVLQENEDENGKKIFTKPISGVEREKIKFPITTEYAYSPEGIEIPLYGYNKTAFKAKNEIKIDDELTIPKGEIVPGFLVINNKKQEVLIIYYDQKEQKVKTNFADSSLFESDITEDKISQDIQFIGTFTTSQNISATNGQCLILKDTTLDLFLGPNQVLYQSEEGSINSASSTEIPYVQEQLESIWEDNPDLKTYAESLGIGDDTIFISDSIDDSIVEEGEVR